MSTPATAAETRAAGTARAAGSVVIPAAGVAAAGERRVGGKALGLARIAAAGLAVPPFCVIASDAFRDHLRGGELPGALGRAVLDLADVDPGAPGAPAALAEVARALRAAVEGAPPAPSLADAVAGATDELGPGPYAVRSSMVGEDSRSHSFAGQLDTALFRSDADDVLDAVVGCYGSAFGEPALAYAARLGLSPADVRVAVVVQRMVDAEVAGVLFTANPVSGRRDECMVTAAYGLGEGIVSGLCATDEYLWSRADGERSATVADKDVRVVRAASGTGTEEEPVPAAERRARALAPEQVAEVCDAGLRLAEEAGQPMDVEWCYADGRLHVLQARPITTLPPADDGAGALHVFDNSNVQESYNGVTTPLTFSFASRAYHTTFRIFARTLGVSERGLVEFEPSARTLIGLVRGRVYYHVNSWLRLLALLPQSDRNREDMATVMWHTDIDPMEEEQPSLAGRVRKKAAVAGVGAHLLGRFARMDAEIERFLAHFHSVYDALDREALRDASLSELHETSIRLHAELLEKWETPNINDFRVMMISGHLRRAIARRFPEDEVDTRLGDLLGGIEGIESVEPTRLLVELATDVRRDAELAAAVRRGDPERGLAELRRLRPELAARVDQYVDRYGDRAMGELKLESVTLRDNPGFVVEVIRNYLDRPELDSASLTRVERERYRNTLAELEARMPSWRRALFLREVAVARSAVKARETLRLRRTLAFGVAREIYRAIGRRLAEAGVLDAPDDVLYLTVHELEAFIEGRSVSVELRPIVAARRAEWSAYEQGDAPNRFQTIGTPYLGELRDGAPEATIAAAADSDARTLRGMGCCGGVVEAPVRLIFSPHDELSVNGKILCTVRTDPGWTPLFPTASGLIVERGSQLSHSAVVAREFGIPTVVGVPGVTRILADGEPVRLDGGAGSVERLAVEA